MSWGTVFFKYIIEENKLRLHKAMYCQVRGWSPHNVLLFISVLRLKPAIVYLDWALGMDGSGGKLNSSSKQGASDK